MSWYTMPGNRHAAPQERRGERGSALMLVMIVVMILTATLAATLQQSVVTVRHSGMVKARAEIDAACAGGIATVRGNVKAASYNAAGNAWLQNSANLVTTNVTTPDPAALVSAWANGNPVPNGSNPALSWRQGPVAVRVYVYRTSVNLYRAIAIARHDDGPIKALAMNMSERDSFSRYIFFRSGNIFFGNTTTDGDVHANSWIGFSQGAQQYGFHGYGSTTANDGSGFLRQDSRGYLVPVGDDPSAWNIFFHGEANGSEGYRAPPELTDLQALEQRVADSSEYKIMRDVPNGNFWRTSHGLNKIERIRSVELLGDSMRVRVEGTAPPVTTTETVTRTRRVRERYRDRRGRWRTRWVDEEYTEEVTTTTEAPVDVTVTLPLPEDGLVYTDRQIDSLQGEISGRMTLAVNSGGGNGGYDSEKSVSLTGPVQYVDSNGNHPYELYPTDSSGEAVYSSPAASLQESGVGIAWDDQPNSWTYAPNPEYLKNTTQVVPPVLGIVAKGWIWTDHSAPYNMVYHGAHISIEKSWTADLYQQAPVKGNWRQVGSKTENGGGGRYSSGSRAGYGVTGQYIYDKRLRYAPPPHFLGEERPLFGEAYDVTNTGTRFSN